MDRGENILLNNLFRDYNSILKVITLPGHESHHEVTSKREITLAGCISFAENLTFFHPVTFTHHRAEVHTGVLIGSRELGKSVMFYIIVKTNEFLFFKPGMPDNYFSRIHKFDQSVTFCIDEHAGIEGHIALNTCTNNRGFRVKQRNRLTHHV